MSQGSTKKGQSIDQPFFTDGTDSTGIDGFGYSEVTEKSYHIDHPGHETRVRDDTVDEPPYSSHFALSVMLSYSVNV